MKRTNKKVDTPKIKTNPKGRKKQSPAEELGDVVLDGTTTTTDEVKQELPMEGVGDLIKKVTSFFGIPQCDNCKKRQELFNATFPWLKPQRQLTQDEEELLNRVTVNKRVVNDDVNQLFKTYNEVFNSKLQRCNCPGLLSRIIERLDKYRKINKEDENN